MFANRKSQFFRDTCHIDMKRTIYTRKYQHSYRMVWIAVAMMILLVILNAAGYLDTRLQSEQKALLSDTAYRDGIFCGTVLESKKGQSYCWMQLEGGEHLYVRLPYEDVNWYPAGTKICVTGVLSLPDKQRNPGGFDEAAWLRTKQTGVILSADTVQILDLPKGCKRMVYMLHEKIEAMLHRYLSVEQGNLAKGLLMGEKHYLDDSFYNMTQQMGIAHIFAVSGLHVGVIGSVVFVFFRQLGWMNSWLSVLLLTAGLTLYCMLAGLPASALRAAGMIVLSALTIKLHRPVNSINFLAFAAVLLLLENPFLLWAAGFQLSFGVTLALLIFVRPIEQKFCRISVSYVCSSIAVVLAAWLGSIPVSAWHFYTISPISPLFNFFLVPLVSIAVPLLLAALLLSFLCPMGAAIWFLPVKAVLFLLQDGTVWMYDFCLHVLPSVQWNIGRPPLIAIILYAVGLVFLWLWLQNRMPLTNRSAGLLFLLMLFIIALLSIPTTPEETELLYLDVGQGSCALLRTKEGEAVLFDAGAQKQELASVLAWYGVNTIDAVILSHSDTDHISGLKKVMESICVQQILAESEQLKRETMNDIRILAEKKRVLCNTINERNCLWLKNGEIVLQPFSDDTESGNRVELTAVLQYGNQVVVFPGDLALSGIEKIIMKEPHITIWTVPHHGSRFSGDDRLYRLLKQKGVAYAVISVGRENRYGHPHKELLNWLNRNQIEYYSTAETGALLFLLS